MGGVYATGRGAESSLERRPSLEWVRPPLTRASVSSLIAEESRGKSTRGARLTVVIVAYVERQQLLDLLDEVARQADGRADLVLVDNGLDPDIAAAVKAREVHYVRATENLGPSGGRNVGTALAATDLVAFFDADATIADGMIDAFLDAMPQGETPVAVRGRVLPLTEGAVVADHYDLGDKPCVALTITEGVSVWRTAAVAAVGGFDMGLYGGEGRVLCYRVVEQLGFRLDDFRYEPRAVLLHDFSDSDSDLEAKLRRTRINLWHIARRFPLFDNLLREYRRRADSGAHVGDIGDAQSLARTLAEKVRKDVAALAAASQAQRLDARLHAEARTAGPCQAAVAVRVDWTSRKVIATVCSVLGSTIDSVEVVLVANRRDARRAERLARRLGPLTSVKVVSEDDAARGPWGGALDETDALATMYLYAGDTVELGFLEEAANVLRDFDDVGAVVAAAHAAPGFGALAPCADRADGAALDGTALVPAQVVMRGGGRRPVLSLDASARGWWANDVVRGILGAGGVVRSLEQRRVTALGSARASARWPRDSEPAQRVSRVLAAALARHRRRSLGRALRRLQRALKFGGGMAAPQVRA